MQHSGWFIVNSCLQRLNTDNPTSQVTDPYQTKSLTQRDAGIIIEPKGNDWPSCMRETSQS